MVAWLMAAGSCVASALDAGRPSGMVAKRKPGRPATAAAPRDRTRRRWLYSVLTKVMWKPLQWSALASFTIGVTYVALRRERDAHGVRLLLLVAAGRDDGAVGHLDRQPERIDGESEALSSGLVCGVMWDRQPMQ